MLVFLPPRVAPSLPTKKRFPCMVARDTTHKHGVGTKSEGFLRCFRAKRILFEGVFVVQTCALAVQPETGKPWNRENQHRSERREQWFSDPVSSNISQSLAVPD